MVHKNLNQLRIERISLKNHHILKYLHTQKGNNYTNLFICKRLNYVNLFLKGCEKVLSNIYHNYMIISLFGKNLIWEILNLYSYP